MNKLPSVFTERRRRSMGERIWFAIRRLSVREFMRTHDEPLLAGADFLAEKFKDYLELERAIGRKG